MQFGKFLLVIPFVLSSCVRPQDGSSQAKTSLQENLEKKALPPTSSSGGSSSSGSSSSSESEWKWILFFTAAKPYSFSTPMIKSTLHFEDPYFASDAYKKLYEVSFAHNVFTTPLFQINYDDSQIPTHQKKSDEKKKEFLTKIYYQFLENVTFGNEIYTLDSVTFKQIRKDVQTTAGYRFDKNDINVSFYWRDDNHYDVFSTFAHEYYHHLSTHKMENLLNDFMESSKIVNNNEYYYHQYMRLFNDGIKRLDENIFNTPQFKVINHEGETISGNDISFIQFRLLTYNYEIDQYYSQFFKLANSDRRITFDEPSGTESPKISSLSSLWSFEQYKLTDPEIFARWSTMMTNSYYPRKNDLPYINNGDNMEDYLKSLFFRTNVYYDYDKLKRSWPQKMVEEKVSSGYISKILKEDLLSWDEIKEWQPASISQMRQKYQAWKDYFTNTFYNTDQLFSGVIRDKDNHLYFELNHPNQHISLEKESSDLVFEFIEPHYDPVGQITYNLLPYDEKSKQKTKLANNYLYKVRKNALSKGVYFVKINNSYLNQGLNLHLLKNQTKTILGVDQETTSADATRF